MVLCFKNCVYTLTLYCGSGLSFNAQPGKHEYQEKSSCQTVNIEKTLYQVKVCKILSLCQLEGSTKNSTAKGLSILRRHYRYTYPFLLRTWGVNSTWIFCIIEEVGKYWSASYHTFGNCSYRFHVSHRRKMSQHLFVILSDRPVVVIA